MNSSYKVGYGQPPKEYQFRPGQSGNPNGRPKQAKAELNRSDIFWRVAFEVIEIPTRSGMERTSRYKALILHWRDKALGGDQRAASLMQQLRKLYPFANAAPNVVRFYISEEDERL